MSTLPIRNALIKAHLTPAHLVKEMNSGLKDSSGEIYSTVRDKYITTIEKIPAAEFVKEADAILASVDAVFGDRGECEECDEATFDTNEECEECEEEEGSTATSPPSTLSCFYFLSLFGVVAH